MKVKVYRWNDDYCSTTLEQTFDNVCCIKRRGSFFYLNKWEDTIDIPIEEKGHFLKVESYPDEYPF